MGWEKQDWEEVEELVAEAAAVKEEEERGAVGAAGRGAANGSGEAAASNGRAPGRRGRASEPRAAGRRNGRPGRGAPRGRLTPRDLELVRFLGRVKLARAEQVSVRFSMARSKTYARLQVLAGEGLVALERRVPGPAVYYATRTGLAATGLSLGEARMSLATLEHDLAVADAAAGLECAGERLYARTEREMRCDLRLEGDCAWRVAVRDTGQGRSGRHWPDLAAHRHRDKGWVAVEVELSQKRAERTRSILAGYRDHSASLLSAVLYLTPDRRSSERIERLAASEGLGQRGGAVFLTAALDEPPDYPALLAEIKTSFAARQDELERQEERREAHQRAETEREQRREAEFRARQEELGREEAVAREVQEREEARLPNRLRRAVRGY